MVLCVLEEMKFGSRTDGAMTFSFPAAPKVHLMASVLHHNRLNRSVEERTVFFSVPCIRKLRTTTSAFSENTMITFRCQPLPGTEQTIGQQQQTPYANFSGINNAQPPKESSKVSILVQVVSNPHSFLLVPRLRRCSRIWYVLLLLFKLSSGLTRPSTGWLAERTIQ